MLQELLERTAPGGRLSQRRLAERLQQCHGEQDYLFANRKRKAFELAGLEESTAMSVEALAEGSVHGHVVGDAKGGGTEGGRGVEEAPTAPDTDIPDGQLVPNAEGLDAIVEARSVASDCLAAVGNRAAASCGAGVESAR